MDRSTITRWLSELQHGKLTVKEAFDRLRHLPYEDLGFARMDNHRAIRQGFPEVIFCEGKTVEQVSAIAARILERHGTLLTTRATPEMFDAIKRREPRATYHPHSRAVVVKPARPVPPVGRVLDRA